MVTTRRLVQTWDRSFDGSPDEEEELDDASKSYEHDCRVWPERLSGRRLITCLAGFTTLAGGKVFHNAPDSSVSILPSPPTATTSRLLLVPLEIRRLILSYVLTAEKCYEMDNTKKTKTGRTCWISLYREKTSAAIIFVYKQLYIEGRDFALDAYTYSYEDLPAVTVIMKENQSGGTDNSVRR